MSFRKQLQSLGMLSALLGTSLLVYPQSSQAIPEFLVSIDFPQSAPSGGGTLSRTYGGGSRTGATSCLEEGDNVEPLTALIPEDTLVKTADSEPTLYVYVPKTVSSEEISATVVILTPGQPRQLPEEVYVGKTSLPDTLNEGGGIVRYKLEGADLKAGETYTWSFSIHCDPDKYDLDRYVRGVFQRVEDLEPLPANLDNMSATSLVAKANEYAADAIWNETVNLAAKLRSLDTGEWAGLLKSVNLPQFESIPFVSCQNSEYCVPEPEDLEF
ncbi:DUF928 domain-containing protein [Spirulina sp. 06S082]|uniref:DUF928 domain-containing protein n=1 Tax=Spirulina sp. 06S082 TaxID=3110248 RepID=UPI002B201E24|nr:DUF928 domain-containing protein [Spirulina sp. 06S082]MEA5467431.1 DUF928 domain-containing protein [Spirulina sp. 06S082]